MVYGLRIPLSNAISTHIMSNVDHLHVEEKKQKNKTIRKVVKLSKYLLKTS